VLLAVGQRLEAHEGVFELVAGEFVAQVLELVDEGMAAGRRQGELLDASMAAVRKCQLRPEAGGMVSRLQSVVRNFTSKRLGIRHRGCV
jgi:hypothetical protein